jgi:hypothetical protein
MAAAMAVAYYGRVNCSTSQSAAAASIANVIEAILFMAALGGGLYPVHRRSAKGVSTVVGGALGFYEGVAAARGNCKHDRNVMIFLDFWTGGDITRRDDCALQGSYTWSWP